MKKYVSYCLLVLFLWNINYLECSMFRTLAKKRFPAGRQYSSPVNLNTPQESRLTTRISAWWSNFKGFMSDWLQTSKMRSEKISAGESERAERLRKANQYVHIQATKSQRELAEIEAKQKAFVNELEKNHKQEIDQMRQEEAKRRHKEWLKRVRE